MKKKILIASLLKPVDDVRSYWKLSKSMAKTNKYEINIIGNASKKVPKESNISFSPYAIKRTQYLKRWLRSKLIFRQFLRLKPQLLIINTPELLPAAILYKWISNSIVVYDIRENHHKNLQHIRAGLSGTIAASYMRFLERLYTPSVDHFWLAEQCYQTELSFVKGRCTVLENKALNFPLKRKKEQSIRLLFSGTISEYSGIRRAIKWYQQLKKIKPSTTLRIIGQIHDPKLRKWLERTAAEDENLLIQISEDPIEYDEILNAIEKSNLGLIAYDVNPVNQHKMPTKLYEYARYRLPYLVLKDTLWANEGATLGGAIPCQFTFSSAAEIVQKWKNAEKLFPGEYPKEKTWEEEERRMLSSIFTLFNDN